VSETAPVEQAAAAVLWLHRWVVAANRCNCGFNPPASVAAERIQGHNAHVAAALRDAGLLATTEADATSAATGDEGATL
jgi:hypothetical protein